MSTRILFVAVALALTVSAEAISDPEFTNFGAGWTTYSGGSGSVNFDGNNAVLNAFLTSLAGIEQEEPAFASLGQEYELEINVANIGNIYAGWRDASLNDLTTATTTYGNSPGVRTIRNDTTSHNLVFAETVGIGGIINIDYMRVTLITAPPSYGGPAGIISATRATATSANLTWNQASDNVTAAPDMQYKVFWSTSSANVISEGVKTTFAGLTAGQVSGLPSNQQVFFTVRASDKVGNIEGNTAQASIPAGAGVADWSIY